VPGARGEAVKHTHPINKPKGIDRDIVLEHARGVDHRQDTVKPAPKDIRPEDVFAGTPDQMGVRNLAETGKDLQKALDKQIPKDKGYDTVNNLSQYLIRTEGGGGTPPAGKKLLGASMSTEPISDIEEDVQDSQDNNGESALVGDDADPIGADVVEADAEPVEVEPTASDRLNNVRRLLPVHAAPVVGGKSKAGTTLKVGRGPGRPRKVERMATTSDLEYHAIQSEEKQRFIDQDPVVIAATKGRIEATTLLRLIRSEIAKEAAALQFQRLENEKFGKDTAQTSTRRIDALTKIANIELEIKKLGPSSIDPRSEEFQRIFTMFIESIRDVAAETLAPEMVDLFFNRLTNKLDGWEDRVANATQ
jgi:hypothetical protein